MSSAQDDQPQDGPELAPAEDQTPPPAPEAPEEGPTIDPGEAEDVIKPLSAEELAQLPPGERATRMVQYAGGLIGQAIRRPVTVTVSVILLCLFGILSVLGLPIQLTPDITIPTISVRTDWPGATPVELETDVVERQEEALKSLPGLVTMKSEIRGNTATINLELEVGASLQEALVRVNNLLSQVPSYPDAVRNPIVATADSTGPPMVIMAIQDINGGDVAQFGTFVKDKVQPLFERVPGVSSLRVSGGRDEEIHVDIDPTQLAARGLTVSQVAAALRAELRDLSGGDFTLGKRRYLVRTQVQPSEAADLANTVLAHTAAGTPIRLSDVGEVRQSLRKTDGIGILNGTPSISLLLFREAGSNVLEVTRQVHEVMARVQRDLLEAENLKIEVTSDQVGYIEGALDTVKDNLLIGAVLAILVLLLFLRSIAASAVVAIAIPVCIIGAALGMSLAGRTVNIVSLAGMAFAVGMVIDNSIVVLEAIDTWRARARTVAGASLAGAQEVWGALVASTFTTIAVFVPILTWQDEVGELLRDVAVAIAASVSISLIVSVIVVPSFSNVLLRSRASRETEEEMKVGPLAAFFGGIVRALIRNPLISMVFAIGAVVGIASLGLSRIPPMEYLPVGNRDVVFGSIIPPPGYSVDEVLDIGHDLYSQLAPHINNDVGGEPNLKRMFFFGSPDNIFMGTVSNDKDRMGDVVQLVRKAQLTVPGSFSFAAQAALFGRSLGGGRAIEIELLSADQIGTTLFAQKVMGAIMGAIPKVQVRPIPNLDYGAPEYHVRPDRARIHELGLNPADVGLVVDTYIDGAIIAELTQPGQPKRDVLLRAAGVRLDTPEQLADAPVPTPGGHFVPLSELATIQETLGPTIIQHIERQRGLILQVTPPDDLALESAVDILRDDIITPLLAEGDAPSDLSVNYSGTAGHLEDAQGRLGVALLLAMLISYLLLAALFESWLAPIAIMTSVPLAGTGGVLGLELVNRTITNQPLDMMTALGFIILIGTVVNNAILVVDGALIRLREGQDLIRATVEAVQRRLRPIAMTTTTSLAGLMPLVVMPGSGSELYRGVGAVVLGGLSLATFLTIFVVPAAFCTLWRIRGIFIKKPLAATV